MSDRNERLKDIFQYAIPSKGSEAFSKLPIEYYERLKKSKSKPTQKYLQKIEQSVEEGYAILEAQSLNGAGLLVDSDLRFFDIEFGKYSYDFCKEYTTNIVIISRSRRSN